VPIQLYLKAHEFKGINASGICYEGLNREGMTHICEDIDFNSQGIPENGSGWFQKKTIETTEEILARAKDVLRDMRELH